MPLQYQSSLTDKRGKIFIPSHATVERCVDKANVMRFRMEQGLDPYWYEPTDIGRGLEQLEHEDREYWLHRSVSGPYFRKER